MMRKISVIAAIMLTIGLTACGNNEEQTADDTAQMKRWRRLRSLIRMKGIITGPMNNLNTVRRLETDL